MNIQKILFLTFFFTFISFANPNNFEQLNKNLTQFQSELKLLQKRLQKKEPVLVPEPQPEHESIFQKWLQKVEQGGIEVGVAIRSYMTELHDLGIYTFDQIGEFVEKFAKEFKPSPASSPEPVTGEEAPVLGPPPPAPPLPTEKLKSKLGLTQKEFAALTPEQQQKSDTYLIKLIQEIALKKYSNLDVFSKQIKEVLGRLSKERAKKEGFEFKVGNSPEELIKNFDTFINTKLLPGSKPLTQYLTDLRKSIESSSIQQEMAQEFDNWVLGNKDEFSKKVNPFLKDLIINIAVLARAKEAVDISTINPQSPQAQQSDMQFVNLFTKNLSKDQLINEVNFLRIDPVYLKFMSLQDDIKAVVAPAEGVAVPKKPEIVKPPIGQEEIAEMLKKLKAAKQEEQKKKKVTKVQEVKQEEVQGLKMGIIDVLQQPKGSIKISQINDEYLQRYLFDPTRFDAAARQDLKRYLSTVVIKPVTKTDIIKYFKQIVNQAQSYNDIIEFMRALKGVEIKETIPFTWKKVTLKTTEKYDASGLRTLETTLKNAPVSGIGNYQSKVDALIQEQRESARLLIPNNLQNKILRLQHELKVKLQLDDPKELKKQINNLLKNNFNELYDEKLENLPINDQLFKIVKTIEAAYLARKG